ncbi:MAG TPA: N-acetylmuramic acid 6-phosphate etherase, partial [Prolixibacteraceae bacterium]|nr:N-acetylmuramic acid 6-phosphate etherase [Prolixibacteraceae bacterium]
MKSTTNRKTSVTESPSNFDNLDKMSIEELLTNINEEDSKVHIAVKQALPQIKNLVEQIEIRM